MTKNEYYYLIALNLLGLLANLPFAFEGKIIHIIAVIGCFIAFIFAIIMFTKKYIVKEISGDEYIAIQGEDPNDYILLKAKDLKSTDTIIISTGTDKYKTAMDRVEKYLDGLYGVETNI